MKKITKDTILKQGNKDYGNAIEVEGGKFVWVNKDAEIKRNSPLFSIKENRIWIGDDETVTWLNKIGNASWFVIIAATFDLEGVHNIMAGYKANQAIWTNEDMIKCWCAAIDLIEWMAEPAIKEKYPKPPNKEQFLQSINSIKEITVDENWCIISSQ